MSSLTETPFTRDNYRMIYVIAQPSRTRQSCFLRFFLIEDGELWNVTARIADSFRYKVKDRDGYMWIVGKGNCRDATQSVCNRINDLLFGTNACNFTIL